MRAVALSSGPTRRIASAIERLEVAFREPLRGSSEVDVTEAGFLVGYESASQFSREYRQLFGSPSSQDIARLREDAALRLPGRP